MVSCCILIYTLYYLPGLTSPDCLSEVTGVFLGRTTELCTLGLIFAVVGFTTLVKILIYEPFE